MALNPIIVNGGYLEVNAFEQGEVQLMLAVDVFYPLMRIAMGQ